MVIPQSQYVCVWCDLCVRVDRYTDQQLPACVHTSPAAYAGACAGQAVWGSAQILTLASAANATQLWFVCCLFVRVYPPGGPQYWAAAILGVRLPWLHEHMLLIDWWHHQPHAWSSSLATAIVRASLHHGMAAHGRRRRCGAHTCMYRVGVKSLIPASMCPPQPALSTCTRCGGMNVVAWAVFVSRGASRVSVRTIPFVD